MNDRWRLWGLRALAFCLALVLWYLVSFERREVTAERAFEVSVTYSVPPGMVLLRSVDTVGLRIRGTATQVRALTPFMVDVLVPIPKGQPGSLVVELGEGNVSLPPGLEIVSMDPHRLVLEVDREVSRLLPVQAQLVGEPAAGAVWETPRITPDRVLVEGPDSVLRELSFLKTSPVTLDGHALTFEEVTTVQSPTPTVRIIEPAVVTIRVPMRPPGTPEATEEEAP